MSDNVALGAAAAALAGAITTISTALRGLADIKSTKDRVKAIEGEGGKGGFLGELRELLEEALRRLEEVEQLPTKVSTLRTDLEKLQALVKRYRDEWRSLKDPLVRSGSFSSIPDLATLSHQIEDIERRTIQIEKHQERNDTRLDKLEASLSQARELLVEVHTNIRHLLSRDKADR
jgi:DNA repair exonuclease SbcCD ATPase subunit